MTLVQNKSGIITKETKEVGTLCGYCPNVIHLHNEADGLLHIKNGKPICARCRILTRSKFAGQIKADVKKFDRTVVERREDAQEAADLNVIDVAAASQKRTASADSKKKKELLKRLRQK